MKKIILALVVVAFCGLSISCSKSGIEAPQRIIDLFPTATTIEQEGSLITVKNKKGETLGYVLNSKPASDGIIGHNGETPLEILFDGKKIVTNVDLLPNQETAGIINMIKKCRLLESWNGLGVDEALTKEVDVVSGATHTSQSIIKTFQTAVKVNMK